MDQICTWLDELVPNVGSRPQAVLFEGSQAAVWFPCCPSDPVTGRFDYEEQECALRAELGLLGEASVAEAMLKWGQAGYLQTWVIVETSPNLVVPAPAPDGTEPLSVQKANSNQ